MEQPNESRKSYESTLHTLGRWSTAIVLVALISVPLAFLAGWIGTITSPVRGDEELAVEMEVRSLTGAGAGEAISH